MAATLQRQRGVTLLVGLIMLVLMTLMAISVFNLGKGNLQIVANMQYRNDALNVAQDALEEVISKTDFTVYPAIPLLGGSNTKGYDVNGDGSNDVSVTIGSSSDSAKPTCIGSQTIQNANLNPLRTDSAILAKSDAGCMANLGQDQGLTGPVLLCTNIISALASTPDDATLTQQYTDLGCGAIVSASPGASLCADTMWDIRATATDNVTQAKVVANVGVSVRVAAANLSVACP